MKERNVFHKVYQKVDQYLTIVEIVFFIIITLFLLIERFSSVVLLSYSFYTLIILGILYYFKAIGDYTQGFKWEKFIQKIPFLGPSMIVIGIAFWAKGIDSLSNLIYLGVPFSLLGTVVYFLNKDIKTNDKYRFLIFTIFGIVFSFITFFPD